MSFCHGNVVFLSPPGLQNQQSDLECNRVVGASWTLRCFMSFSLAQSKLCYVAQEVAILQVFGPELTLLVPRSIPTIENKLVSICQ